MKFIYLFAFILLQILPKYAQAHWSQGVEAGYSDVGNGGGGIVCKFADGSASYEFYDVYRLRKGHPDLWQQRSFSTLQGSFFQIAHHFLDNLMEVDPYSAQMYKEIVNRFKDETYFFDSSKDAIPVEFKIVNDTLVGEDVLEDHCYRVQIANQYTIKINSMGWHYKLAVDQHYFQKLDNFNKAILILHEAIYSVLIDDYKVSNADRVWERLKSIIFLKRSNYYTENAKKQIMRDYVESSQYIGYPNVSWNNWVLRLTPLGDPMLGWSSSMYDVTFYEENQQLKKAFLESVKKTILIDGKFYKLNISGPVEFFLSGQLKKISFLDNSEDIIIVQGKNHSRACASWVQLSPEGKIVHCN